MNQEEKNRISREIMDSEGLKCKFCGCPVQGAWLFWVENGQDFVGHYSCMVEDKQKKVTDLEKDVVWMREVVKKSDKLIESISKILLILLIAEEENKNLSEFGMQELKRIGKEALREFQKE